MDSLPRDVQLKIIKHFDIDTRLILGIPPCVIKIPDTFEEVKANGNKVLCKLLRIM